MAIIISILFGIVEGITEWLPVSSTGHMILFNALIHFENYVSSDFYSMYEVVIQLGAILAVALLFFKALWPLKRDEESNISLDKNTLNLWLKIIISSIPAACIIPFDDYFEDEDMKEEKEKKSVCQRVNDVREAAAAKVEEVKGVVSGKAETVKDAFTDTVEKVKSSVSPEK